MSADATVELVNLVKTGDDVALEKLLERCIPALRRWARGRLPQSARGVHETADLVQDAVVSAVRHLGTFEVRHQGAVQAYFRQAVMNRIRDILRQQRRRPQFAEMPEQIANEETSALDRLIGADRIDRYEAALQALSANDREAIIGRIEMQYSYQELAVVLDKPSAAAARMAVVRATKRLAELMQCPPA